MTGRDGAILTMDPSGSRVEAVAVRDGRIIAAGSAAEIATHVGRDTESLELDGRTLLPGLIDPHMHAAMVQMAGWVDVSPMATPTEDDVLRTLREAPPLSTGWVIAKQFDPSITAGHPRLDREVLDRLAPDRPMLVLESNGHVAYANSAAMRTAGVDRDSPDPPAARYGRRADDEMLARHRDLFWHAASKGVTLLHDCGIGVISGAADLGVLTAATRDGSPVRYRGMLVTTLYDTWVELGLQPGFGDDLLRIDGMKAWSDGSNQAATGFQREPYLHRRRRVAVPRRGGHRLDRGRQVRRPGLARGRPDRGGGDLDLADRGVRDPPGGCRPLSRLATRRARIVLVRERLAR